MSFLTQNDLLIYLKNKDFYSSRERFYLKEYSRWVYYFARSLFFLKFNFKTQRIAFYSSKNQLDALNKVSSEWNESLKIFTNFNDCAKFPIFSLISLFLLFLFLPVIILPKKNSYFYTIKIIGNILLIGFTLELKFRKNVEEVFIANDHLFYFRSIVRSCNNQNIKITYIQHGCIGKYFPNLDSFSRVYLDGPFSKSRYDIKDKSKIIYIKNNFKECSEVKFKNKIKKYILVCLNSEKEINNLDCLISFLEKSLPNHQIKFRLHKYLNANQFKNNYSKYVVTNIYDESIETAFKKAICCIAGNSSVLIDAMSSGTVPIYFYSHGTYDYYGFVKSGIVKEIKKTSDLFNIINNYNFKLSFKKYYG